ncbi:MAG: response regulator [Candidatus Delongbacteria bacterium]|jgi:signal transduction histidine kinase/CheY-like chemotaxis protein|nr:response regulator [Candidatus Delongbacteria bacterium]
MKKNISRNTALKIALIFLVFSLIWIFLTDNLVFLFYKEPAEITNYQSIKGALFVIITTLLIYYLIRKEIKAKNNMIVFLNRSEHWYNLTLSNIPGVDVLIFDKDARIILAHGKELAKHGIDLAGMQNIHVDDVHISQPTYDFFVPKLNKVLSGNKVEAEYTFKQDTYFMKGIALENDKNEVFAGLIVIINITPQHNLAEYLKKQKNEYEALYQDYYQQNKELMHTNKKLDGIIHELEEAKKKAEESDKLKSSFLANMSHEIRTPLNGIMGFPQLIANNQLSHSEIKDYGKHILHNSEQLLNIIEDVLLMSSLETEQYHFNPSEYDVTDIFNDAISLASKKILKSKKSLELEHHLDPGIKNMIINTDKNALLKVSEKIIDNAVKYSPDSAVVNLKMYLNESGLFCLSVHDQGSGIPKNKQTNVFERFFQLHASLEHPDSGNGLGLSIADALVKGLNGEIRIKSEENEGSEFVIMLPGNKLRSISDKPKTEHKASDDVKKGNKILIVEDLEDNCILLKAYLRRYNVQVLHAPNAREAREIMKQHPDVDLIMMDIRLPDENGLDLTSELKEQYPDIPIIAQTAYSDTQDEYFSAQAGCNDYLAKPIMKQVFLNTISEFIDLKPVT